jgi:tetratricopeptide (TPR) repeat protein
LRNERLNIGSLSLESHFSETIEDGVRRACGSAALLWSDTIAPSKLSAVREILNTAADAGWDEVEMKAEAFGALRALAYDAPRSTEEVRSFRVVTVHGSCRWCESCLLLVQHSETRVEGSDPFGPAGLSREGLEELEEFVSSETGQPWTIQLVDVPALPRAMWRSYVVEFGSPREREVLATEMCYEGVKAYVNGNVAQAVSVFESSLDVCVTTECLNNLGYLQFAEGDLVAARVTYERAAEQDPLDSLVAYNLAITLACDGDWEAADRQAERASQLDEKPTILMHIPVVVDGELTTIQQSEDPPGPVAASHQLRALMEEVRSPDL